MKIRTASDLIDRLDQTIIWRKKELTLLKKALSKSKNKFEETVNIRIGITLLYAHFEGFIKEASSLYIIYLNNRKIKIKNISTCFQSVKYMHDVQRIIFSSEEKIKDFIFYLENIPVLEMESFYINPEKSINTKSNLNSAVFHEITQILGLNYELFKLKEKLIDYKLLKNRNNVAHGEHLPEISTEETLELFSEVITILEKFKNSIENAVVTESYLK